MTLPFSKNTTYAPLSQIKSNDLNDLQDMVVGARHGYEWFPVEPLDPDHLTSISIAFPNSREWRIPVATGMTFRKIRARVLPDTDAEVTLTVTAYDDGSSISGVGGTVTPVSPAVSSGTSVQTVTFEAATPVTITKAGHVLVVKAEHTGTANNVTVYAIEYEKSR